MLRIKPIKKILLLIRRNKILIIILFIGSYLRFVGIYPGFPYYHSDEPMIYRNAASIIVNQNFLPDVYAYPTFLPFFHAALYLILFIPLTIVINFFTGQSFLEYSSLSQYFNNSIIGYREINTLFWSRYINAILGVVNIIMVYYVAKRVFNKTVGIFAATLLAFNYRHVLSSHYALPDVANGLFFLISLSISLEMQKSNTKKVYILAGIISALSVSIKYSPFGFLMCLLAHLFKFKKKNNKYWSSLLFFLFFFLATLIIVNPFHVINFDQTLKYLQYLNYKYNAGTITFLPYPYVYLFRHGIGQLITLLALIGIILSLKTKLRDSIIMLVPVFLIFYSLTIYSEGGIYVRNFVSVIPIILIFASLSLENLLRYLIRKLNNIGLIVFIAIFSFALITPIYNSVIVPFEYSKNWNLTNARDNKEELINKKVAGNSWFLDQIFSHNEINKIDYSIKTNFTFTELQEAGAEYLVLDSESNENYFTWWMKSKSLDVFYKKRKSAMIKTFPGGAIAELVSRRNREFLKPWQAYENSIFFIPIPKKFNQFETENVLYKNFEVSKNSIFSENGDGITQNIFDEQKCIGNGCLIVGTSLLRSSDYKVFGSTMLIDPLLVKPTFLYKVKVKIRPFEALINSLPDGVFKVELFKNEDDLNSGISGSIIFYSSRYHPGQEGWQEKEIIVDIPADFRWMKLSMQIYENSSNQFYIDELIIEKSVRPFPNSVKRKYFPEDVVFINSII